uniref:Uncharacterized protein n=1 Tax=Solanum tuberosum TaxID=4113 RepID=M1DBG7_SOLTU
MSSGGDCDRHREDLGVSQTNKAKMKKSTRRPIDPEDISGSISSAPERISHDTHLFSISFGYSSTMTLIGSVSPSSIAAPSATPDVEMPTLALSHKDKLGRVMIEPDGSS